MKFATKPIQHYPRHLRHVATLLRDIKNYSSKVGTFLRHSVDQPG